MPGKYWSLGARWRCARSPRLLVLLDNSITVGDFIADINLNDIVELTSIADIDADDIAEVALILDANFNDTAEVTLIFDEIPMTP